jgi:tetratricopeptide (TPR) repeat protein
MRSSFFHLILISLLTLSSCSDSPTTEDKTKRLEEKQKTSDISMKKTEDNKTDTKAKEDINFSSEKHIYNHEQLSKVELSTNIDEVKFSTVYPRSIWQSGYVIWGTTAVVAIGAAVFTVYTGGAGAPAAAAGTSTFASWIAGGGAGSYMAGLSMVGSTFGGNAMLGAAILNGASAAVIGGTATKTVAGVGTAGYLSKVALSKISRKQLDNLSTTDKLSIKQFMKANIDSGISVGENIYVSLRDIDEFDSDTETQTVVTQINEALDNGEYEKVKDGRAKLVKIMLNYLKKFENCQSPCKTELSMEDLLILTINSYNSGYMKEFRAGLTIISENMDKNRNLENNSFYWYLNALDSVHHREYKKAIQMIKERVVVQEKEAIEPYLLLANLEFYENGTENLPSIVKQAEDGVNYENHETPFGLYNLYSIVGNAYYNSNDYDNAEKYLRFAWDTTPIFAPDRVKATTRLGLANALYSQNKKEEANKLYMETIEENCEEMLSECKSNYLGNI